MSKYDKFLVASDDPILKRVCVPVAPGDRHLVNVCKIMERVCKKGSRLGVGLAAPQIGYAYRLVFINCKDERGTVRSYFMVNPVIVERSEETNIESEECLSYPGKEKRIARPDWIRVKYETMPMRVPNEITAYRFHARVICHELDHLDGICRVGDDSPPDGPPVHRNTGAHLVGAAISLAMLASLPRSESP